MPQIKPFTTQSAEIAGRKQDTNAERLSRPGNSTSNPPSTNFGTDANNDGILDTPFPIKLSSSVPPPIPETGKVPLFNPVTTPLENVEERTVNKGSVHKSEKSINETVSGGRPNDPEIIARNSSILEVK